MVIETEEMMGAVHALNKETVIAVEGTVRRRAETTLHRKMMFFLTSGFLRSRYRYFSRVASSASRLRLIWKGSSLYRHFPNTSIFSGTTSISPVGRFLFLLLRSRTVPSTAITVSLPARKHPGKFYALPQAPQQFKQLLMTSGFDRYFQIAPCFRDEDARGDRTPGEFYQLDMEMSFASQDDVLGVLEDVLVPVFRKFGIYDRVTPAPFKRIRFNDAMELYGTDKPDLRIQRRPSLFRSTPAVFCAVPTLLWAARPTKHPGVSPSFSTTCSFSGCTNLEIPPTISPFSSYIWSATGMRLPPARCGTMTRRS